MTARGGDRRYAALGLVLLSIGVGALGWALIGARSELVRAQGRLESNAVRIEQLEEAYRQRVNEAPPPAPTATVGVRTIRGAKPSPPTTGAPTSPTTGISTTTTSGTTTTTTTTPACTVDVVVVGCV